MSASDTSASGGGKQSSILLLTPSLELARAFLLRFYEHCQLSLPPDVLLPTSSPSSSTPAEPSPTSPPPNSRLQWTSSLPWSIENKYYSASVRFVLRQLGEEGPGPIEEGDGEGSDEEDEEGEDGYPAVMVLLDSSQVDASSSPTIPAQVRQTIRAERPDVALAFSLSDVEGGFSSRLDQGQREELEERLVGAYLEVGMEYVAQDSALVDADEDDRAPPPYEQLVQSLSSHMWPTLNLKSSTSDGRGASASDTISALAGLLGGMGGFGLDRAMLEDEGNEAQSDFTDEDDDDGEADQEQPGAYAQLNEEDDFDADGFGEFIPAENGTSLPPKDLDAEHREAGWEFRSALASSSVHVSSPTEEHAGWTTFDGTSTWTPALEVGGDESGGRGSILDSFGPPPPSSLDANGSSTTERGFSSSFAPPSAGPTSHKKTKKEEADPTEDLGAMLSHLNSLRSELAGVTDDDERRKRAALVVQALFGDDIGEESDGEEGG